MPTGVAPGGSAPSWAPSVPSVRNRWNIPFEGSGFYNSHARMFHTRLVSTSSSGNSNRNTAQHAMRPFIWTRAVVAMSLISVRAPSPVGIVARRATDRTPQRKSVTWSAPFPSTTRGRQTHQRQQLPRHRRPHRHQPQHPLNGMITLVAHPAGARLRDNPQWALCRPHLAAASETTTRTDTQEGV